MTKTTKPGAEYVVAYRMGGELRCLWRRVLASYTLADAIAKRDELQRMGYAALVERKQSAESLGLPIGWSSASVDWERDEYSVTEFETRWTSHRLLKPAAQA